MSLHGVDVPAVCPPHRWNVSGSRIDGALCYHHECVQCGAQKDVPVGAGFARRWRTTGGGGTDRRAGPPR